MGFAAGFDAGRAALKWGTHGLRKDGQLLGNQVAARELDGCSVRVDEHAVTIAERGVLGGFGGHDNRVFFDAVDGDLHL